MYRRGLVALGLAMLLVLWFFAGQKDASADEVSSITMEWFGDFYSGTLTMTLTTSGASFPRDFDDGLVMFESDTGWHVLRNMWEETGIGQYTWIQYVPTSIRQFRIDSNVSIDWNTVWPWEKTPEGKGVQKDYKAHITQVPSVVYPGVQFCINGYNLSYIPGDGGASNLQ